MPLRGRGRPPPSGRPPWGPTRGAAQQAGGAVAPPARRAVHGHPMALGPAGTLPRRARGRGRGRERGREGGRGRGGGDVCGSRSVEVGKEKNREGELCRSRSRSWVYIWSCGFGREAREAKGKKRGSQRKSREAVEAISEENPLQAIRATGSRIGRLGSFRPMWMPFLAAKVNCFDKSRWRVPSNQMI